MASWVGPKLDVSGASPRSVLVLRALQLGDLLCSVPTLRALRSALPDARITLLGLPWASEFVRRYSRYVDDFIAFPGFPGLPETPADVERFPRFLEEVRSRNYDLAIQLHGSGTITNPLISLMGAKACAGLYLRGHYCPDPERFIEDPPLEPEVWRGLRLMEHLGVPLRGEFLEFWVDRSDYARLQAIERLRFHEYVCIHPGARAEARRWKPEFFAKVADVLSGQGYRIVLTGTSGERAAVEAVQYAMRSRAINLVGKTDLGTLGALLSGARLLICNDTGVSHLAAALRVPSVVVFHRSELQGWPPLDRRLHRVVSRIGGAEIDDVLAQVMDIISSNPGRAAFEGKEGFECVPSAS